MDKPKNKYDNKRIGGANIDDYLKSVGFNKAKMVGYKHIDVIPYLQNDYGEEGDCTLVSILTVVKFYKPQLNKKEVYDYIEKIAKKYLYKSTGGTLPFFNKNIVKEVFKHFDINKQVFLKSIKGIGFNENTIINQLKNSTPVIISITRDGRKYYDNHTITIIGYNIYENENGKKKIMFRIYDNGKTTVSFLDYDILRNDCIICY